MKNPSFFPSLALAAAAVLVGGISALAQTYTTTTATTSVNWSGMTWTPSTPSIGGGSNYVLNFTGAPSGTQSLTNDLANAGNPYFLLNSLNAGATKEIDLYGSNLVFVATTTGGASVISNNNQNLKIFAPLTLSNNITLLGSGGNPYLNSVISGSGNITNSRTAGINSPVFVANNASTFAGNWIINSNAITEFQSDACIGGANSGIVLNGGGGLQWYSLSLGAGRNINLGSGLITFNAGADGRVLTLAGSTNNLTGSGTMLLEGGLGGGAYNQSGVNLATNQPGFSGQIYAKLGGTIYLSASNALNANATVVATNGGTIVVSNGYALSPGTLVVSNGGTIILGTSLPGDSTLTNSVDANSAISGTDATLAGLANNGNLLVANGAMIVHQTAYGTGIPVGLDATNFVYGIAGSIVTNMTIGDAAEGQWRGVGAGKTVNNGGLTLSLGTAANTLTLNGNADLMAMGGSTLLVGNQITGGSAANGLFIRGPGSVNLTNLNNNFTSLLAGGGCNLVLGMSGTAVNPYVFANGSVLGGLTVNPGAIVTLTCGAPSSTLILAGNLMMGSTTAGNCMAYFTNGTFMATNTAWSNGNQSGKGQVTVQSNATLVLNAPASGRNYCYWTNCVLDGGTLVATNYLLCYAQGGSTTYAVPFTITNGGTFNCIGAGVNWDSPFNPTAGNNASVLVNQSSGSVLAGSGAISLGGTAASMTHTYNLSGGLVSGGSLQLGADIGGTAVTTFNLLGGKLLISGTISGAQAANAKQDFVFNSGTLAAGTIDMTKLVSGGSVGASAGCLTNNGGTLAPGDVGSSGKMTITGNYTNNSSSSVLDIDLNGATQAGIFADPGKYDFVSISGKAQIGGNLNVRVGSGYTPGATTAFTVLTTSANGLSGSFANVRGNGRYYSSNPAGASFLVINTGTSIIVSNVVPLTASFTASPSAALTNNPLATFTDTSIGFSITNRVWNFGDGTTVTNNGSTTQNHTFPVGVAASYNVVLAVTGDDGSTAYATNVYSVVSQFRQIVWAGTANTWDFAANDWLVNGSTATAFGNSDNVVFDQTGAAQPTVNLNVTAVPYSVTFSNTSAAYTIQGAGKITGATGLTLGSGGSVTLLTTNNYTGPTVIKSGTLTLGNGATSGSIDSTSVVTNNGALVVNQADSHSLPAIVGSGSLTKLGAGALTLNGANTYTGSTAISNGTLTVATSLSASSPVLVASGTGAGALTVNAGATVGGNVEAQVSSAAANANVVNNGTISGTLTLDGTANQGNGSVASGNATLNGGSATGPVVDEGQLTIAGSTAVTVGTINGVTGFGAIHQNNTVGSGVFLNLANGASLANLNFGAGTATTVTNHGTVTLGYYGLSANVNWFSTLVGGIWNITNSIGANNANTVNYGTNTLLGGAVINVPSTANGNLGSQWTHGTWNLINGSLNIGGSLGSINGNTNSGLNITVNNSGGGASELTVSNNYSVGMSYRTNSIAYNSLTIGTGGSATINNNLYVGDTTGAATQISETNVVNLSGGKLLVAGTISAAPDGTGRTASFNWTGGQLTANTITAGAGFNNLSSSLDATTLTNSAGTLAPGDLGVSGETIINGNYVQAGSGVLAIDIGGTNAAIGFQNGLANYDNLQVNGTAELGGTLTVSFINGFVPSGSVTNTIINASGGISGAFSSTNLPSLPAGYSWQVEQTATLLNLVVTAPSSGTPTPTNITFTVSGGQMTLNWPNSLGWVLEAQTNSLSTGLVSNTNAWTRMSAATSPFIVTPDAAQPTVFYRLVYP